MKSKKELLAITEEIVMNLNIDSLRQLEIDTLELAIHLIRESIDLSAAPEYAVAKSYCMHAIDNEIRCIKREMNK